MNIMTTILKNREVLASARPDIVDQLAVIFDARDELIKAAVPEDQKLRALKNLQSLAVGFVKDGASQAVLIEAEKIIRECLRQMAAAGLIGKDEETIDATRDMVRERVYLSLAEGRSEAEALEKLAHVRSEAMASIDRNKSRKEPVSNHAD